MDPPPARSAASKRRERRRRAAAAAATGAGSDVLAVERGGTAQGSAAAAASSSSSWRHREARPRLRRGREAITKAKAEASKSPRAPVSATLGGETDAQGYLQDTTICVSDVVSIQRDSSLLSGCCLEVVKAHQGVSLPQPTAKKRKKRRSRNLKAGNKTTNVYPEDGVANNSLSCENSVGEIEDLRSKFLEHFDVTCQHDNCTALGNADTNMDYPNEDPKCPVMSKNNSSRNKKKTSPDCRSLQELEEHKEKGNVVSVNSSKLEEEKKKPKKRKARNRRNRCKKTTSQDHPLSKGADDSGLVVLVSEGNTSCHRTMTNSISVDVAKAKEGESVNLGSITDQRCEMGSNLHYNDTEINEPQKQDVACSEDNNAYCQSPSSLAEAYVEMLKVVSSPRRSFIGFPKKKLLVLDLNGLVADINQDFHNSHMADAKVRGKLVFRRPYCDDFLKFCSWNFDLGIWSSRKKENVASVVNIVMRDFKPFLLFCWDMSKCTFTGHKTLENKHKPLVLKELRKLWNKEDPDLPWEEGDYSPSNTLLVDDSPYKALLNPPYTAIFPRPYSYMKQDDNSLGPGGDLRVYLQNLAAADDVESYVRNNPFGQPFITKSDPHWNFYAQIADRRNAIVDEGASPLICCA